MKKFSLLCAAMMSAGAMAAVTEFSSADVPDAKKFKVAYELDPLASRGQEVTYTVNNAADLTGKVKRVGYFLELTRQDDSRSFVFVSMDAFTEEVAKIGVPTKKSGARFQDYVKNLEVISNVEGLKTGKFEQGNIEFWDCNYRGNNDKQIPGADDKAFDFGDAMTPAQSPGYGSMQVHNFAEKQTVFAYNKWNDGKSCDIGIGNNPKGNPDWTFTKSGSHLKAAKLTIVAEME